MTLENESPTSPRSRAARLKEARDIAGFTLKEMASTGLINFNTLCGWETAKHGGLTERGALLIVKRLSECNTQCSIEWLLYGQGEKPSKKPSSRNIVLGESTSKLASSIHKLIIDSNPDLLCIQITDSSMVPKYNIGDYVYGFPFSPDIYQLSSISDRSIIVKLETGDLILRKLRVNQISNEIILTTCNQSFHPPFLYNPKIEIIATIICHIRNDGLIL